MTIANAWRKSIEIFAVNFGTGICGRSVVDVENSDYNGQLNGSNLHNDIFGSIIEKPNLVITTVTTLNESVLKTTHSEDKTLINMANAELYFSNFIARNLRAKDIVIEQSIEYQRMKGAENRKLSYKYSTSNEKNYAEIYNVPPSRKWLGKRQRLVPRTIESSSK